MFGRIKNEGKVTPPFKHHAMEIFRGSILHVTERCSIRHVTQRCSIRHVTGRCSHLLSPDALPPELKTHGIHWIGGWMGRKASLDMAGKKMSLLGIELLLFSPKSFTSLIHIFHVINI
jgi:hypothetical protein